MTWRAVEQSVNPVALPVALEDRADPPIGGEAAALLSESDAAIERGEFFRAIELLREAEDLAPGHPVLQRRFGIAYTLSGNRIRGAVYLRRSLERDPADLGVLVLLSQHVALRGGLDEALGLCRALAQTDYKPLANLYRSQVLGRLGYTAAAADRLSVTLGALDALPVVAQRQADPIARREMDVLRVLEPELRMRLGDLMLSLDQADEAAAQYARIDLGQAPDPGAVVARRAYLSILADDRSAAVEVVVALLSSEPDTLRNAELVGYLSSQGVPDGLLAARLLEVIDERGGSMPLLAGLARVADKSQSVDAIAAWMDGRPGDPASLRQAASLVRFRDDEPADAAPLVQLLLLTADQMRREPSQAGRYAQALLGEIDALVCLLRALRHPALVEPEDAVPALLSAMGYAQAGRAEDAIAGYQRALTLDPALGPEHALTLARLLAEVGRGEEADALLDTPVFTGEWQAMELRVLAAGTPSEAGGLIDGWEREQGEDLRSRMLRIHMTARWGRPRDACQSMIELINDNPTDESLYVDALAMINDYFERFDDVSVAYAFSERFASMLILNLPESLPARLEQAIRLYGEPGREAEMRSLLDAVLIQDPMSIRALSLLVLLHQEAGDQDAAEAAYERLLLAGPPGLARALARAGRSIEQGDHAVAIHALQRALALDEEGVLPGPEMTGDDAAHVLQLLAAADPEADHEAISLRMVRRFPNNPVLNNALGYRWTVRGVNLLQARAMIQRALDQGGEHHAVLDSMAWVQYKLGEFALAEAYQRRAIELLREDQLRNRIQHYDSKAVLYDHMGDIMYRQGDHAAAQRHWQIALSQVPRLTAEDLLAEPELETIGDRLEAKLAAVREGGEPAVEPVPGPDAHGLDAHPADLPGPDAAPDQPAQ